MDREQLLNKRKQWERFNAWEAASSREFNRPDEFSRVLRWFGEAWELARESDPHWAEAKVDPDKIRYVQETRKCLALLRQ